MGAPAPDRDLSYADREGREFALLESRTDMGGTPPALEDFSIFVGGPVYDFLLRIGLVRLGFPNILRRIVVLVAVTWLPLLLLSLKDGFAFGHQVRIPLLYDFSMYGRFLLGLPLLILAEIGHRSDDSSLGAGVREERDRPDIAPITRKLVMHSSRYRARCLWSL